MHGPSALRWMVTTAALQLRHRARRTGGARPEIALLCAAIVVGGCITGMAALALRPRAGTWVAFGVSIGVAAVAGWLATLAARARHRSAVAVAVAVGLIAVWTVIATAGTFPAGAARWLAFASALGYIVQPLGLLVAWATRPLRVVHVLEVRGPDAPSF